MRRPIEPAVDDRLRATRAHAARAVARAGSRGAAAAHFTLMLMDGEATRATAARAAAFVACRGIAGGAVLLAIVDAEEARAAREQQRQ